MSQVRAEVHQPPPDVPDLVTVEVAAGTKVLVTSDLHLQPLPTEASTWAEEELAGVLGRMEGPAVLVLAGDIIELWAGEQPDAAASIAAHPRLAAAVEEFRSRAGRRVVCLPGNHDGRLGWDLQSIRVIRDVVGAELAFTVDLALATTDGTRTVHIEHGHRWDPANRFEDPRDPLDHPLGQHVVQEILPDLTSTQSSSLLHGMEALADPRTFPAFVTSRVFYNRLVRSLRWLLVPLLLAVGIHYGIAIINEPATKLRLQARDLIVFDVAVAIVILVTAGVLVLAGRHTWHSATTGMSRKRGRSQNDNTRAAAQQMVAEGYAGLICGHTHHPELTTLGSGFYANTGSGTRVIEQCDARLHFPHVFLTRLQLSYLTLEATGQGWKAELWIGHRPSGRTTRFEHLMARKTPPMGPHPEVVSSFP